MSKPVQQQCGQVLAALAQPRKSPEPLGGGAVLQGETHTALFISGLVTRALLKGLNYVSQQNMFLAFRPVEIFHPKHDPLRSPRCLQKLCCRIRVNLQYCHNLYSSLQLWFVNADTVTSMIKSVPKGTELIFHTLKQQKVLWSLCFLTLLKISFGNSNASFSPPERPLSFRPSLSGLFL